LTLTSGTLFFATQLKPAPKIASGPLTGTDEAREARRREVKRIYRRGAARVLELVLSQRGIEAIANDPQRVNDMDRIYKQRLFAAAHLLGISGFATHRELAEHLGIERSQVSEALAKMQDKLLGEAFVLGSTLLPVDYGNA
jgi:hypothetical protein